MQVAEPQIQWVLQEIIRPNHMAAILHARVPPHASKPSFQPQSDATETNSAAGMSQPGTKLPTCPLNREGSSGLKMGAVGTLDEDRRVRA